MKSLTLFFVVVLSSTILIACERLPPLPVKDVPVSPQTNTQFAQEALSDLADTAAERKFTDLANAASDLAETLAIDDGTSVEPIFSKIAKLAGAVTILEHAFTEAGCEIELEKFAEASIDTVKAYTIRDAASMDRALQNLAQEAVTAGNVLWQLPAENAFIQFVFGYGLNIDVPLGNYYDAFRSNNFPSRQLGIIDMWYDDRIRPAVETSIAVIQFLTDKGYEVTKEEIRTGLETIYLGSDVDPLFICVELDNIPGVSRALPKPKAIPNIPPWLYPPSPDSFIINRIREKYNQAWCQGNFATIDSILIEESGLDFFDYTFARNLANIYAEEFPETAERIKKNRFSLRSIANIFFEINRRESDKTVDETIELFRQSIRTQNIGINHKTYDHYYLTTDYWKQLVTDHLTGLTHNW